MRGEDGPQQPLRPDMGTERGRRGGERGGRERQESNLDVAARMLCSSRSTVTKEDRPMPGVGRAPPPTKKNYSRYDQIVIRPIALLK